MEHTERCERLNKEYEALVSEFEVAYPNYCRACRGWGYFVSTYDPSPRGVSLGSGYMMDVDICEECEAHPTKPHCSLCGAPILESEWDKWQGYDEAFEPLTPSRKPCGCITNGLPEPPECVCWYELERHSPNVETLVFDWYEQFLSDQGGHDAENRVAME